MEALDSLSVKELKAKCKASGVSQTGEKATLVWRLKLQARGAMLEDGRTPFELKSGELKKVAAKMGVNPMGTNDELLEGIVEKLEAATKTASSSKTSTAVDVAKRALALFEDADYEGILSLGSDQRVSKDTDTATLQKCYRRLSLALHPDKLRTFDRATQAFQAVVTALERLTEPELHVDQDDDDKRTKKKKRISRSNENCVRTRVRCPRCEVPWGENASLEGLPEWSYNVMMTGLRGWTCSTCLCEFGCASAIHECRKCGTRFDYSPDQYHSQVDCDKCKTTFGFWQFPMSDRALNEAIAEAKKTVEVNAKRRAAKKRRASAKRDDDDDDQDDDGEAKFLLGLIDECPRCGEFFGAGTDRDDRQDHLEACTDAKVHAKHKQRKIDDRRKDQARQVVADRDVDVQAKAAWDASGSTVETMWMLPDSVLARIADKDDDGENKQKTREDLLLAAAAAERRRRLGTKAITANGEEEKEEAVPFTADSLPANYASLSVEALRAVCAAHGLKFPARTSKRTILAHIDCQLDDPDNNKKLLLKA